MAIGMIAGLQSNDNDLKLTLSQNFININKNESATVTVDTPSDGKIYATSSNPSIATASINNNIITINAIKYGSAIIYIGQDTGTGIYTDTTSKISRLFVLVPLVIESTLDDTNWEIISEVSQMGTGNQYWSIGDTKSITLNGTIGPLNGLQLDNVTLNIFILHFNYSLNNMADNNIIWGGFKTNDNIDIALWKPWSGSNTNGISWNSYILPTAINWWRNSYTNISTEPTYGGWKGCDLRFGLLGATEQAPNGYGLTVSSNKFGYDATSIAITNPINNTLMAALPNDFRSVLRLWDRWIDAKGMYLNTDEAIEKTIDAISLLTEFEVFGTCVKANPYECNHLQQIEYYKIGNNTIKYRHDTKSTAVHWWLASPAANTQGHFCIVYNNGLINTLPQSSGSVGISPVFKT